MSTEIESEPQVFPILIVDDNELDRYLLKRKLKDTELRLNIVEKTNGQAALEYISQHEELREQEPGLYPPLVIFLDINMPRMNGFEFLSGFSGVREDAPVLFKSSIIMMFTSSGNDRDRERALSFDFVKDYLVKGAFTSDELRDKLIASLPIAAE